MKIRSLLFIVVPLTLIIIFGLTYIPHHVIKLDSSRVSKILIFNGHTGQQIEIVNYSDIEHIITNLNSMQFQKGKPSIGYMGYSFRTTIYNDKGKVLKELIINSNDRIRYKGFFYTAIDKVIDYHFIDQLFSK